MSQTNDFLDNDYEVPSSGGNYMKFNQGETRFRIISKPVIGWQAWDDNKKVHRFPKDKKPLLPLSKDPKNKIQHFWAMIVHNVDSNAIQVLVVTQGAIQTQLANLSKDQDWGAPYAYDIKVTKTGADMQTKYAVTPCPKKPVSSDVEKMALDKPINLDGLFGEDGDPFLVTNKQTELMINTLPF
jgi:hypothetical protein